MGQEGPLVLNVGESGVLVLKGVQYIFAGVLMESEERLWPTQERVVLRAGEYIEVDGRHVVGLEDSVVVRHDGKVLYIDGGMRELVRNL